MFSYHAGRWDVRGLLGVFTLVAILSGPATSRAGTQSGNEPHLVLVNPIYNFGTVLGGPPIKHVFTIKNEGKGELIIGQVMASCGCTAAKPDTNKLAPGQSTRIAVAIDSGVLRGHSVHTVTVFTNDPKQPNAELKLVGDVQMQVTPSPLEVDFGKVAHGTMATRTLVLTPFKAAGFKVGDIKNNNPDIEVARTSGAVRGNGVELKLTLKSGAPVGPFVDTIEIATNRVPVKVGVYGTVTGEINVDPPQVSFGIVQSKQSAMRIVRLTNSGNRDVKITGIDTTNTSVTAGIEPVKPGKEYKITVELRQNTPDGQIRGQLVVKTDDPEQSTVTIPYYGIVGAYRG
jgi:hypothetical protein